MIAVRARVVGRVQGVGFRWHTMHRARSLGLRGWVRNVEDGSVDVHLEGPERAVDDMLAWLGDGPEAARVDDLVVTEVEATDLAGFEIRK